ncbi:hypothetical protein EX30DRAFT_198582 [Ascodesmis nigricans]|uniref:Uncharacterized protein n=1 Tax=Ascodesmis nigricans TaxID=341454 RepID=A0A4S2MKS9_9PEZI|nr:hypothetical protein EX30DRAFT_198582 [Ascodesmis nigricans]
MKTGKLCFTPNTDVTLYTPHRHVLETTFGQNANMSSHWLNQLELAADERSRSPSPPPPTRLPRPKCPPTSHPRFPHNPPPELQVFTNGLQYSNKPGLAPVREQECIMSSRWFHRVGELLRRDTTTPSGPGDGTGRLPSINDQEEEYDDDEDEFLIVDVEKTPRSADGVRNKLRTTSESDHAKITGWVREDGKRTTDDDEEEAGRAALVVSESGLPRSIVSVSDIHNSEGLYETAATHPYWQTYSATRPTRLQAGTKKVESTGEDIPSDNTRKAPARCRNSVAVVPVLDSCRPFDSTASINTIRSYRSAGFKLFRSSHLSDQDDDKGSAHSTQSLQPRPPWWTLEDRNDRQAALEQILKDAGLGEPRSVDNNDVNGLEKKLGKIEICGNDEQGKV